VKLSPAGASFTILDRGGPESPTPGTWSCEYFSLRDLLSKAFAVDDSQISGPPWMENQRFHINAKLAPATTREQFREMLRNLLIDRFALASHIESRAAAHYELTVPDSGHKLRESGESLPRAEHARAPGRPELDAAGFPKLGPPTGEPEVLTVYGRTSMFFPSITMKDLAEILSFKAKKLVTDMTGLKGQYDIGLYWSEDDLGPNLQQALRDQLGLRLAEKKGPVQFLVVQHIERLPTTD
jgi:uncharacterized protein (TIGR03435 family)